MNNLPPDIEQAKNECFDEFFKPYNLSMPAKVEEAFNLASEVDGSERIRLVTRARNKAEMAYYGAWLNGDIKKQVDDPKPMSAETKAKLKELNELKRAQKLLDKKLSDEREARIKKIVKTADLSRPKKIKDGKKHKSKVPLFLDLNRQMDVLLKYPWVTKSFRQDLNHIGGTIADIKCQKCGTLRTCKIQDFFQVKYCHQCK